MDLAKTEAAGPAQRRPICEQPQNLKRIPCHSGKKFAADLIVALSLSTCSRRDWRPGAGSAKRIGKVMKEILGTPEDIPQDLLNKAECVIVLPSVKKVAVGIGPAMDVEP